MAQERRRVAETRVNARSSRSHSIFTMKVRCSKRTVGGRGVLENVGKLHLVDLAGSENAKKASQSFEDGVLQTAPANPRGQAGGEEERERRNINQSLLTLGRVINALREGTGRVPYRDSKLTRLLQDALGGRCKTVIIATVSPALGAVEETISTLTYAEQACGIKNKPVASSLFRTLRQAKDDGSATFNCGDFAELELKAAYLAQEVEEAQAALARQYRESQEYAERATAAELRVSELEHEVTETKREVEGQTYARNKLAVYADVQYDESGRLSQALDAGIAHSKDLTKRLENRCHETVAVKKQARDLCEEAEASATALAEATRSRAKQVEASVSQTHEAHRRGAGVAEMITEQQQAILAELLQKLHKEVSEKLLGAATATATDEASQQPLGTLVAEARKALEEAGANASKAFGSAAGALKSAAAAAADLEEALSRTSEEQKKNFQESCEEIGAELEETNKELIQRAEDATATLKKAEEISQEQGKILEQRFASECRAPLMELIDVSSAATSEKATDLIARLGSELKQEHDENAPASNQRWQSLLAALAEYTAEHDQLAGEDGPQQALRKALLQLKTDLEKGSEATGQALKEAALRLTKGRQILDESTETGLESAKENFEKSNAHFEKTWDEELKEMNVMETDLQEASKEQAASLAAKVIQQCAADASQNMVAALTQAVNSLAASRAEIAEEVAGLQQQRASEKEAIALLSKQKEALQLDVVALQSQLTSLSKELDSGRKQLENLQGAQQNGRKRVLEAIVAAATTELDSLGDGMEVGSKAILGHLAASKAFSEEAGNKASAAAEINDGLGEEIAHVVADWSEGTGLRCNSIEKSQATAKDAAGVAEAANEAAKLEFGRLGSMAADWGAGCERVSAFLESATSHNKSLKAMEAKLRPEWHALRKTGIEIVETWAAEGHKSSDELKFGSENVSAATEALGSSRSCSSPSSLYTTVLLCQSEAEAQTSRWEAGAADHSSRLAELASLASKSKEEEAATAGKREENIQQLEEKARHLGGSIIEDRTAATSVLRALEVLSNGAEAPLLTHRQDAEAALNSGSAAFQASRTEISKRLTKSAKDVSQKLSEMQSKATKVLKEDLSTMTEALGTAVTVAQKAAEEAQQASTAATAEGSANWQKVEETRTEAVNIVTASADSATNAAESASSAGSRQVQVEVQKGNSAKELTISAVSGLAAGAFDELMRQKAAVRKAVSANPLAAYETITAEEQLQTSDGVPNFPEAAKRPDVELKPRPSDEALQEEFDNGGVAPPPAPAPKLPELPVGGSGPRSNSEIWVDDLIADSENTPPAMPPSLPTGKTRKPSPARREAAKIGRPSSRGPTPKNAQSEKAQGGTPRQVLGEIKTPI
eukprot:TRINITY_DN93256_c0_g1_i1.p1 TRINITY_DN93256_c0_g1~~TRINITY_DN93256_c0_g1_i1.p1  ORF type:complete len:1391 (-),score=456.62 TRINITY_DN93256_c0_g1_i1:504-4592(-)